MALTIRSVAFPVPGGLGVQESGYVLVGNLLGIPGETAFALSLIARVRELGFGIPGLIGWQLIEGRRLLRARAEPASWEHFSLAIARLSLASLCFTCPGLVEVGC